MPSKNRRASMLTFFLLAALLATSSSSVAEKRTVDFSYSPAQWQSAICFPDDPHKTVVDRSGELLYHFNDVKDEFGTRVSVRVTEAAVWQKQQLHSPRIPIVRTYWNANHLSIVQEALAIVPAMKETARNDLILVQVTNTGLEERTLQPMLLVDTKRGVSAQNQRVVIGKRETVTSSLKMTGSPQGKHIALETLTISPGKTATIFVVYSNDGATPSRLKTVEDAFAARSEAVAYWETVALPYGRIQVPDAGIQGLIDSSTRNIWQARELKGGYPAFQVGPTCYRSLWIVDGAFLLEAATILGAGDQARNGVAYELSHQKPDGRIQVMVHKYGYWKENGIVLWTCARHAMLTQDPAWLESQWPKLQRIAGFIKVLRGDRPADASLEAGLIPRPRHTPLDERLMPHGIIDGGIFEGVEYTNTYWNLLGLRSFIEAARWLGKTDEAAQWQHEYDDFMAAFRKTAARDMRKDSHGNAYLPILMGEQGAKELPQRAQWAFCHAIYPGQIFAKDDPLVVGNLAMLKATEREGMVLGTGWDTGGIWTYFASFYGHAWLWQGDARKAADILYAFANHAAPVLDWREEQSLRGKKFEMVGDMPHNWASAEFVRLTVHLLALDRGDEMHLLEGMPAEWLGPGMVTRLNGIATPFGPLDVTVQVQKDGKAATLEVKPLAANCKAIIVHLPDGARREIAAQQGGKIDFPLEAITQAK